MFFPEITRLGSERFHIFLFYFWQLWILMRGRFWMAVIQKAQKTAESLCSLVTGPQSTLVMKIISKKGDTLCSAMGLFEPMISEYFSITGLWSFA